MGTSTSLVRQGSSALRTFVVTSSAFNAIIFVLDRLIKFRRPRPARIECWGITYIYTCTHGLQIKSLLPCRSISPTRWTPGE